MSLYKSAGVFELGIITIKIIIHKNYKQIKNLFAREKERNTSMCVFAVATVLL